ncbi:PAS and ANTAR domain-containing protein [Goekera deserti]|uniref:ANTAR domain-containing protein n=1 Tax=Goekera deserti TaxID=2497753 RepID=A0A7K3WG44_9ACTN|nr:PAS and ANTAR domain-containing protein [Goekera deserti]NDI48732.1 ANTAR domain-containing protein [Goekera deserti]NEL54889.1 ANTAR domain-containing protein [Goekera deserti]
MTAPVTTSPRPAGHQDAAHRPAPLTGRYRAEPATGAWYWSPQLSTLLGLQHDSVQPGIDVLVDHLHPDERDDAVTALARCTRGAPSTTLRRFRRVDGTELRAIMVTEPELDDDGTVIAVSGLVVALPDEEAAPGDATRVQALEAEVEQLRTAMASRAAIEQAKGVLMLFTGFTEQACFDLLGHISSHTHRKVRDLALEITASAAGRSPLPEDIRVILHDACPPATPSG